MCAPHFVWNLKGSPEGLGCFYIHTNALQMSHQEGATPWALQNTACTKGSIRK